MLRESVKPLSTVLSSTFRLRMFTARKIHSSQFRLTRCSPRNSVWSTLTRTAQRRFPVLFTEAHSAVTKEHLHFSLKSMQVRSRCGLHPFRLSCSPLPTDTLTTFMKSKRLLKKRVCVLRLTEEARKSDTKSVRHSLKRFLICS